VLILLFGGSSGRTYHLMFDNGGQLVTGNEVLVAGQKIGGVESIDLTEDAQADVTISVDEPLHEGTTAIIRATSLSGIANRYVALTPGPNSNRKLPEGARLGTDETTSIVDLDQLFNTFKPQTRRALQKVISGSATIYNGHTQGARRTYKYFAPSLNSARRLFDELDRVDRTLSQFLVTGSRALGTIAERRNDLAELTVNANQALGAIAAENSALGRTLEAFPPALRQANTTFVNLRATLDDLDPVVTATKRSTKNLTPFLRRLRQVSQRGVPVIRDLSLAVNRPGKVNDLTDALRLQPGTERVARRTLPNALQALDDSQPTVQFIRPYSPDLFAWLQKFAADAATYDADGHYVRVSTADANVFHYCQAGDTNPVCADETPGTLAPIPLSQQFNDLDFGLFTRCPGGATQPIAGSNPFLDGGNLDGECDPSDVPPG
jgi:phospholipid/cholesterol/gamma-HCH transport system substrate-binding protein